MIHVIPYEAAHWMALQRDMSDAAAFQGLIREKTGVAYSAIDGDMILGSAGVIAEGTVGGVWALLSKELKERHTIWFLRTAKSFIGPVVRQLGLLRVEAMVNPALPKNCQWIEWMGFKPEGVKRRAGPGGADMVSYVLLPERE